MKKLLFLILIIITIFFSFFFNKKNTKNRQFVEKYFNEDFSKFRNKTITIRGYENQDNVIIFIYENDNNSGFIRIIAKKEGNIILKQDVINQRNNCDLDTNYKNDFLIKHFLEYEINFINIDSNDNVFVKTTFFEGKPDLIRFSDKKYITEEYKKNWINITENWYEFKK
jgi:hypothetical protein